MTSTSTPHGTDNTRSDLNNVARGASFRPFELNDTSYLKLLDAARHKKVGLLRVQRGKVFVANHLEAALEQLNRERMPNESLYINDISLITSAVEKLQGVDESAKSAIAQALVECIHGVLNAQKTTTPQR